jgi:hypothetical protein
MKNDIAEKYLEEFKSELNFLQKIAISPINKKLKEMMISWNELEWKELKELEDLWRWRNILWFMSPWLANKIYDFLKEKQQMLVRAETQWDLQDLFYEVKWIENPDSKVNSENDLWDNSASNSENNSEIDPDSNQELNTKIDEVDNKEKKEDNENSGNSYLETWTQLAWPAIIWVPVLLWAEKMAKNAETRSLRQNFSDLGKELKLQARNNNLAAPMKSNLLKSADEFADIAKGIWDADIESFTSWSSFQDHLPVKSLRAIDPKIWSQLSNLPDNVLKKIAATNDEKIIQNILSENWFSKVAVKDKHLLKALKNINNPSVIKSAANVIKNQKNVLRVLRWLKGIALLDVIMLWVDIWMRDQTMDAAEEEAKVNKVRWDIMKSKAYAELAVGISLATASIAAAIMAKVGVAAACCATVPVFWWIAAGIIIVWWVVATVLVSSHYEKKEFYSQNKANFLVQERTDIKQALLHNAAADQFEIHSSMRENIKAEWVDTVKDALEALIYQEHLFSWEYPDLISQKYSGLPEDEYKKSLSWELLKSHEEQSKKMQETIDKRMEYIYTYFKTWSKENTEFISKVKSAQWLESIENLLAESKLYLDKSDQWDDQFIKWYEEKSIDEYKEAYKDKLKEMDSSKFELMESLYNEDKIKFYEICTWAISFWWFHNTEKDKDNYMYKDSIETMDVNLDYITRFFEYKNLGLSIEKKPKLNFVDIDYAYYCRILMDINTIKNISSWNQEDVKHYFALWLLEDRSKWLDCVSDNTGQNIIYRIAKEFHGYDWANDQIEMMNFFSVDKDDARWLYYTDKWKINIDWSTDWWIDLRDIDQSGYDADTICKLWFGWNDMLDSPVEAVDDELNIEYKRRIHEIVKDEMSYQDPVKKKDIESKIIDLIKNNSEQKDGWQESAWYIKLPYSLMMEAKRAKIWDVENYLFKYENGKITAISIQQKMAEWKLLDFSETKTSLYYERISPLREELTKEEQTVIDRVDNVRWRLEELRSLQSWWAEFWVTHKDEISIPIEIEHIISQKWLERENLKESLFYMNPRISISKLNENREDYYSYFEGLYIGLLATISQFTRWDNVEHIRHINKAYSRTLVKIVQYDEEWNPKVNESPFRKWEKTIDISHLDMEDDEKEVFLAKIKDIYQWEAKSVQELLLSTDDEEQKKGNWMARQILISIFETETVYFNTDWSMRSISCNADQDDEIWNRLNVNLKNNKYIDPVSLMGEINKDSIQYDEDAKISKVTDVEKKTYENVKIVLDKIVKTKRDVDRNWRRLDVEFHIDDKKSNDNLVAWEIESWSNKNSIEIETSVSQREVLTDEKWSSIDELSIIDFVKHNWSMNGTMWNWVECSLYQDWNKITSQNMWFMNLFMINNFYSKMIPWKIYEIEAGWSRMKIQKNLEDYQYYKSCKIKWLDIDFGNIEDLVQASNFINRIKWHYLKDNPDRKWEFKIRNNWKVVNVKWQNITILKKSTVKDYYSSIHDSDINQSKFLSYINNL